MSQSHSQSYKEAGVDVVAGYEAVKLIKPMVESTFTHGAIGTLGGFGGLFKPDFKNMAEPVLVSGTDGVGTKLKLAFIMDKHDTIGIDAVAMCVNDIICCGAQPLFFLDYIAVSKNVPQRIANIVSGVVDGCKQAGCALIGGETAEMPDFYKNDEYDIAGFAVGIVDKQKMIDGTKIKDKDVILGICSSGIHSNGYSLVRKIFGADKKDLDIYIDEFGKTLGDELLTPTKIYVNAVKSLVKKIDVKAISHITGGGFYENIPRMLTDSSHAVIIKNNIPVLPVFDLIAKKGDIPQRDMYNTFNMGIGLAVVVDACDVDISIEILKQNCYDACVIGEITSGQKGITLI